MKIAILGDTHLGANKSSDIVHDYFEKFYADFFSYCETNSIGAIIQTGDLFDYRREVHFNTLHRVKKYFLEKINVPFYALSGNHDCLFKNTNRINSLNLLIEEYATEIVDLKPKTVDIGGLKIDLFPWINNENLQDSLTLAANSNSSIAIGHFEFANFPLSPGNIADHGMDHKLFSRYSQVLSGHFHTQSVDGNVRYVGTPYELTWIDCNDPKGFWILDSETEQLEFVKNRHNLFVKVEYVEDMKMDFSLVTDKYVKIVVVQRDSQKKFDDFISNIYFNKPHDVKIIEQSVVKAVSEAVDTDVDMLSTKSIIDGVIDSIDTQLDLHKLKNKMSSKYAEAMNILSQL